jgi:hypothetical protein
MRHRRLKSLATALAAAFSACTSRDAASSGASSRNTAVDSAAHASAVQWFDGVEPLLLVPAHSNDRALVVQADSTAPDLEDGTLSEPGTLVRLDGSVEPTKVAVSSASEGCVDASLLPAPNSAWGVGFVGTAPRSVHVDSLRAISRTDSTILTPTVFRLASSVPNAPGGRFEGLPFSLVDMWRFRTADGVVVVATTKRQINQEDSPLEERTLIIAESDQAGVFSLAYSVRSTGAEETVEGSELLAVVAFAARADLELVFAHDFGQEGSYSVVERASRGKWKLRWMSGRLSC